MNSTIIILLIVKIDFTCAYLHFSLTNRFWWVSFFLPPWARLSILFIVTFLHLSELDFCCDCKYWLLSFSFCGKRRLRWAKKRTVFFSFSVWSLMGTNFQNSICYLFHDKWESTVLIWTVSKVPTTKWTSTHQWMLWKLISQCDIWMVFGPLVKRYWNIQQGHNQEVCQ